MFYLLYLSWITVYFTLPSSDRFPGEKHSETVGLLKLMSIVHTCAVFAFALTLLITAPSFGNTPECNKGAVVVLFRPFSALPTGRIVCWVLASLVVVVYACITVKDHIPPAVKRAYQKIRARHFRMPVVQEVAPNPDHGGRTNHPLPSHGLSHSAPVERLVGVIM